MPEAPDQSSSRITFRSVAIGLLAVALLCWASPYQDLVLRNMLAGGHSAPLLAVLFFVAIVLLNGLCRWTTACGLAGRELAVVFCMLLVASGIPSMGLVDYLIPTLVAPFYYASATNDWANLFQPHIPEWLVPSKDGSSEVLTDFVKGGASVPWDAWTPCLFWWGTLLVAFYAATFSLCAMFSQSWIREERLSFPLMELPISIFEEPERPRWRTPVFLAGLMLPVFIYSWNNLGRFLPGLPPVPLGTNLARYVGPSMGVFNAKIYPCLIGFFYFVPTTVTCGVWIFFLFLKAQRGLGSWLGTDIFRKGGQWYGGSSELHQAMGAMLVLMAGWIWVSRSSLGRQFRDALKGRTWAPWCCLLSLVYIVAFWAVAGASVGVVLCYFVSFLAIGIALTRLVAQAGLPYVQCAFYPTDMMTTVAGTSVLSVKDLSLTGLHFPLAFDPAGLMMPSVFNSLKVADHLRISKRGLLIVLGLAVLVALPVSFYSFLSVTYEHGGSAKTSGWFFQGSPMLPFKTFQSMLKHSEGVDWHGLSFVGVGAAVTGAMLFLLRHFPGWPVHPLGYILSGTFVIQLSWLSCLLAWLIKIAIVRLGGGKAFRAASPFFLGLVLGGFITPGLWAIIDLLLGEVGNPIPTFPP